MRTKKTILFYCLTIVLLVLATTNFEAKSKTNNYMKKSNVTLTSKLNGIKEYQLSNGLKVILKQNHNIPLVTFSVWYRAGSRNETDGIRGIAHFLEHMMFKGTKKLKKGEISETIQKNGGIFNAFTFTDGTAYYETISPKHLEKLIKIESDRMKNSLLDQNELDLERTVVLSELEGGQNSSVNLLDEKIKYVAYEQSPYKHPVIGYSTDVNKIDSAKMREFYEKYYIPNNAFIVLTGDFNETSALNLINNYFGKLTTKDLANDGIAKEALKSKESRLKLKKSGSYKLLQISYHIPEFKNKDIYALNVIEEILFKGRKSPLHKKLVEKNLVTEITGGSESNIDPGLFTILVSLTPKTSHKEVEKIITNEIKNLIKNPPNEETINAAKNRIKAGYLYGLDGSFNEALNIGFYEIIDNWKTSQELVDRISRVTKEEIIEATKKYLSNENRVVGHFIPTLAKGEKYQNEPLVLTKTQHYQEEKTKSAVKVQNNYSTKKVVYKKISLKDGSKLLVYKDTDLPITYVYGAIPGGSSLLPKEQEWYTEIIARSLDKGSKNYSKKQIEDFLDSTGSYVDFSSNEEGFRFEAGTLNENLDSTLALLTDLLMNPTFPKKEIEVEKKTLIAEIIKYKYDSNEIAKRKLSQIIYPKDHHSYMNDFNEDIESVKSIRTQNLKKIHETLIKNNKTIVSLASNIPAKELNQAITTLENGLKITKAKIDSKVNIPTVAMRETPKFESIYLNDKHQSDIFLAHTSDLNRTHPDYYKMHVANFILGGGILDNRLSDKVRDQNGLVYSIYSYISGAISPGEYGIYFGANNKNTDKAISLTMEELNKFVKNGITEKELSEAKKTLINSFTSKYLSSYKSICNTILAIELYELGNNYINDYPGIINSLKLKDINKAIKNHIFPSKLNIVVAGDYQNKDHRTKRP